MQKRPSPERPGNESGRITKKLQAAFATQFKNQEELLGFLHPKLESIITNPTGLDQSTKTALNSSAIENNAVAFQNATKAQQAQAAARGDGASLPSGVQEQDQGELAGQAAGQQSPALNHIQLEDANLKNANQRLSISLINFLGQRTARHPIVAGTRFPPSY